MGIFPLESAENGPRSWGAELAAWLAGLRGVGGGRRNGAAEQAASWSMAGASAETGCGGANGLRPMHAWLAELGQQQAAGLPVCRQRVASQLIGALQ